MNRCDTNFAGSICPLVIFSRRSGAVVALTSLMCSRYAQTILRPLGETGTLVFMRLSAFILLCLGIQILWDGLAPLLTGVVRQGLLPGA